MQINQEHFQNFQQSFTIPPQQGRVGCKPLGYLKDLWEILGISLCNVPIDPNEKLDRWQLRSICRNSSYEPLVVYSLIMAWGVRDPKNFKTSISGASGTNLSDLIIQLRDSDTNRKDAFLDSQRRANHIKGLGISFYTKLMYFLRPNQDAYILDQFSAKSAALLCPEIGLRVNRQGMPDSHTTAENYEKYCTFIEELSCQLGDSWTPDSIEQALFGKGYPWRDYVKRHFRTEVRKTEKRATVDACKLRKLGLKIAEFHNQIAEDHNLPGNQATVTNSKPIRVHCRTTNGVTWQYSIQNSYVHSQIFIHRNRLDDYEALCCRLVMQDGNFGDNIWGTPVGKGITASIRKTTQDGASSDQECWNEIAQQAVHSMELLYNRFASEF